MDQSYFKSSQFRMPLTPMASTSASPYDSQGHDLAHWLTGSGFDEFADASANFRTHSFAPDNVLYKSPYPPNPVQTPSSANFSPGMSMDQSIETQMECIPRHDSGDSPSLSDAPEHATEEAKRHRRERRRAQNRAAQRAFRMRKEETIKEISAKLSDVEHEMERLEQSNEDLSEQIRTLKWQVRTLERENEVLKAMSPSASPGGETSSRGSFSSARQSFSKPNDSAAAMANGCF